MSNNMKLENISSANANGNGRTLWQEIRRRFKKNKFAMISMYFLIFLMVVALATIIIDIADDSEIYNNYVIKQNLKNKLKEPDPGKLETLFGCDEFGRSIFFRMVWGTRYSLFIGLIAVMVSLVIGGLIGAIAGYYGGKIDNTIMRFMDMLLAIPYMLLAIAIVSALGPSLINLLISIAIPKIPSYARIVRASVMSIKDLEFIEAGKSAGASDIRTIFKYIVPNAMAPVIVQATLGVADAIISISALSYLGLGVQPPLPEWGAMLSSAKTYIRDAWHITIIPGLGIMLTILALNIFGDGLRDALDPKLQH